MKANANYFLPDKIESKVSIRVNSNSTNEAEVLTGLFAASTFRLRLCEYVRVCQHTDQMKSKLLSLTQNLH